jgi:hypothetical protein
MAAADGMHRDRFAPLGDEPTAPPPHAAGAPGGRQANDWRPEMPAPGEPPAAPQHPEHGAPVAMWTYRDAAGRALFAVARFNAANGDRGKEILPLTFGTLRGRRGWHWRAPPAPARSTAWTGSPRVPAHRWWWWKAKRRPTPRRACSHCTSR